MNGKLKTALAGVAVVAMLAFASAPALAGEPVLDPAEGDVTFTGTLEGAAVVTAWLGTIQCQKVDASGTINTGGKAGSMTLDMTGCHIINLGLTTPCQSISAPLLNTIKLAGTFETTYLTEGKTKPGLKFTIPGTTIGCGFKSPPQGPLTMSGSVLGTLSTPACGAESNKGTVSFTGNPQDRQITGTGPLITWTSTSNSGNEAMGDLLADLPIEFSKSTKVTCV
jgi:hypothetical protein